MTSSVRAQIQRFLLQHGIVAEPTQKQADKHSSEHHSRIHPCNASLKIKQTDEGILQTKFLASELANIVGPKMVPPYQSVVHNCTSFIHLPDNSTILCMN